MKWKIKSTEILMKQISIGIYKITIRIGFLLAGRSKKIQYDTVRIYVIQCEPYLKKIEHKKYSQVDDLFNLEI